MKDGIKASFDIAVFASLIVVAGGVCPVAGQQPVNLGVVQTAFNWSASDGATRRVQFLRKAPRVGDEVEQNISIEMRLTLATRQANELIGKHQMLVRTNQRRIVTTTEIDGGKSVRVKVTYAAATKQTSTSDDPTFNAVESITAIEPRSVPQPVQGKTYSCRRAPGENGELVVTDETGNRPPTDEYEIVAPQMEMVGRPNPLAQFLAGRTIAVGEKIELPNDVAGQVFNLDERFGKVTRFALTLQNVQTENGTTCAIFQAKVEAAANAARQMRLEINGPLVVDVATCRARRIELTGPIGMSETRGSYSTTYQVIGTGRLQLSTASTYSDAQR